MGGVIQAAGPYTMKANLEGTPFSCLARAIAHQQLNGTAANTILEAVRSTASVLNGEFPTPQQVLDAPEATLRAAGFSFAKIASLRDLATKTIEGVVPDHPTLSSTLSNDEIIERLTQVRGIGRWTVEMMLMFQLDRPDVLPVDDFGVRNGFRLAYGLRKMPHRRRSHCSASAGRPIARRQRGICGALLSCIAMGSLRPSAPTKLPRVLKLRRAAKC